MLAFTSVYFFGMSFFNALQPIQTKILPLSFGSPLRLHPKPLFLAVFSSFSRCLSA
jgi:hypothetical protein